MRWKLKYHILKYIYVGTVLQEYFLTDNYTIFFGFNYESNYGGAVVGNVTLMQAGPSTKYIYAKGCFSQSSACICNKILNKVVHNVFGLISVLKVHTKTELTCI